MNSYHLSVVFFAATTFVSGTALAVSLNWAGLPNLFVAAAPGLGAYAYAVVVADTSSPTPFAVGAAVLFASLVGASVGLLTQRFQLDYYAMVTLAFVLSIQVLARNFTALTGGPAGIVVGRRLTVFGLAMTVPAHFAVLSLAVAGALAVLVVAFQRSRAAVLLTAFHDDEVRVAAMGYETRWLRVVVSALAAMLSGIAGVVSVSYIRYVDPSTFSLSTITPIVFVAALVGTPVRVWKLILAAIVVAVGPELIKLIPVGESRLGATQQLLLLVPVAVVLAVRLRRIPMRHA